MHRYAACLFALIVTAGVFAQQPSVQTIIEKSVRANQTNFNAAPNFNYKERDRTSKGFKTSQVIMIEGSPYYRLIALNDRPLTPAENAEEQKKLEHVISQRHAESSTAKQKRIEKYEADRRRNNQMMGQLTKAFEFALAGERKLRGFEVWVLKATPRPDYKPPNMETQVLPGMQGELWVDQKSYNWVRVTAQVIHPVSIEGFLAQVEPGTRFELENAPVGDGIWQASHFSMKSQAKVLYMFNHASQDDETYSDYQKITTTNPNASQTSGH